MKKLLSILALALFACAFTFVACGEDDEPTPSTNNGTNNNGGSQGNSSPLIGKWTKVTSFDGPENETVGKTKVTITSSYEFKSDGTFESLGSTVTTYTKVNAPAEQRSRATGTYTYQGNLLAMTYTWTGFWDWNANEWRQQGEMQPYTSEFIVTIANGAITIAPKARPDEAETYVAGEGGNSGDLATQILGSWYLTEVSADKLLVNVIVFNAGGQGTFSEIKAKAKNNWEVTEESAPFTYTLSGNRVTMVFTREGQSETRVGDIVMNADGSASVTHDSDGGQSSVTQQMLRLNGKTGREIMNELLNNQNGGNSGDLATQILGSWYLIDEVSASKIVVGVFVFNANGQGTQSNIKAKAENNWAVTEESANFTYTLNGNRITMVFVLEGHSETRVGDIVMNADGSASVTHDADGGQTTVTDKMLRLNGKTGREVMDELLNNQNGGGKR